MTSGYTYDKVGNRKTSSQYPSWTYDVNNRLTSYNGTSFTYDNNGNTITKTDASGTTTYNYDYENRLSQATSSTLQANYSYDPFGKRLSKTVAGVTKYYLYDNEDIIAEYGSSGNILASFVHGQGIDEPISMNRGGSTNYYTMDGLGSVAEITDSSQNVVESYKYDAFGKLETPPATGNPYTYTAREYDAESGLYYYRARYYDAGVGRFITPDPIGFEGGVNFYTYSFNNPINLTDPFGKQVETCTLILAPTLSIPGWVICAIIGIIIIEGIRYYKVSVRRAEKRCPPCIPPVGTTGYRLDTDHCHGGMKPHVHLYERHQNPINCQCFWHPTVVTTPPPPPGAVPI